MGAGAGTLGRTKAHFSPLPTCKPMHAEGTLIFKTNIDHKQMNQFYLEACCVTWSSLLCVLSANCQHLCSKNQ